MNDQQSISDRVAQFESDLDFYRRKSESDDSMIQLLKRQNETQAMEMATMANDHAEAMRKLRQERDVAVRDEKAIRAILEQAAAGIVQGMRKLRGDQLPPAPAPRPGIAPAAAEHSLLPAPELPTEPIRHPTLGNIHHGPHHNPDEIIDDGLRDLVSRFPVSRTAEGTRR